MSKIGVTQMRKAVNLLEEKEGFKCTLLGIGPMSLPVIEASFLLAKEKDFPLMFIASRNQIDSECFGRGYVCNWDQSDFIREIKKVADKTNFDGIYHICRDHGGPWQRDEEKNNKLAEAEAMDIGIKSFIDDMIAGFDLLHVDPTKDPHSEGIAPIELTLKRTVSIIDALEKERIARALPRVAYEVGTEDIVGGLTSPDAYSAFIKELTDQLKAKGLPLPDFIVGQTGTLTRLTENVGDFDPATARHLSEKAAEFGVGLKEHNGDYLSDFILHIHPLAGISGINVAPEFGVAETEAYLLLHEIENFAFNNGLLQSKSDFYNAISVETVRCERWRKWMVDESADMSVDAVLSDEKLVRLITETGGHYTFEAKAVKESINTMFENLSSLGLRPESIVLDKLKRSIGRYVECLNLEGLTSKIKKYL